MDNKETIIKKSIFIQRTVRKIYEFKIRYETEHVAFGSYGYKQTHTGIVYDYETTLGEKQIFVCDLEMPILQMGENFYIEELNKLVRVKYAVRTSQENMCYYIEDEVVEDEVSKESKAKAEELQREHLSSKEKIEKLEIDLRKIQHDRNSIYNELCDIKQSRRYKMFWRDK